MKITNILSQYEFRSQYLPAFIATFPVFIIIFSIKNTSWFSVPHLGISLTIMENMGLSVLGFYLLMQLQRFLGKYNLEKKIFNDATEFPTTQMLLFRNNVLSMEIKTKIRKKVLEDFNIDLPNEEMEKRDIQETLRRINEAVSLIRSRVKNGRLCINFNIQYGFFRNLIAGFFFALPLSILSLIVCAKYTFYLGMAISILIGIFFTILFLTRSFILKNLAGTYAKNLFIEYLSLGDKK